MNTEIKGNQAFRYLEVELEPGETIHTESGAMATMDAALDVHARLNGGFFKGLARKFLGSESLFINQFTNNTSAPKKLTLTTQSPGDLYALNLNNQTINLEGGAYVCSTPGIRLGLRYAGIGSFLGREGLFKLEISGTGTVWFASYGAFVKRELRGECIVDSGHLVAYEPSIKIKTQLSGGLLGSFLSGEGLVMRLEGSGSFWMQTRSLSGLASWVNPRF
jgi:uncharacterized protein (TIGR00266 family)